MPSISLDENIGTTVRATTRDARRAIIIVKQKSSNITEAIPPLSAIGRNTSTVVRVDAITAINISLEPFIAASFASPHSCLTLKIFSRTTIELSTSIPTTRVRAQRVIRFRVISWNFISANVASRDVGIDTAITRVVFIFPRNRKTTSTASKAPARADDATDEIELFM